MRGVMVSVAEMPGGAARPGLSRASRRPPQALKAL